MLNPETPTNSPPNIPPGEIWPRVKTLPWLRWNGADWVPDDGEPGRPNSSEVVDRLGGEVRRIQCNVAADDSRPFGLSRFKLHGGEPSSSTVMPGPAARTIGEVEADFERGGKLRQLRWREVGREAGLAQGEGQDGFRVIVGRADDPPLHPLNVEAEIVPVEIVDGAEQGDSEVEGGGPRDQEAVAVGAEVRVGSENANLPRVADHPRHLIVGELSNHAPPSSTGEGGSQC